MKKLLGIFFLFIIISGCSGQKPEEQVKYLEGYWEIKRVEITPDSVREYQFNETLDHFAMEGNKGIRKKVRPRLDGTFEVTDNSENIEAVIEEDELYLKYTTPYDSWRERVIQAEENDLKIQNEQGIIYHYQRYTPIKIDKDETEQ